MPINILIYILVLITSFKYEQSHYQPDHANIIALCNNSNIDLLRDKFSGLKTRADRQISILHIGDSHIQAGFYTEQIKNNILDYLHIEKDIAPGIIFPYSLAGTNNPLYYSIESNSKWVRVALSDKNYGKNQHIGMTGIAVQTSESDRLRLRFPESDSTIKYAFDQITVLSEKFDTIYYLTPGHRKLRIEKKDYSLKEMKSEFDLFFQPQKNNDGILYGFILENSKSPFIYHSIGVNGATANSYLNSGLLEQQLSLLSPDLIIISLGTNDAYDNHFNSEKVYDHFKKLTALLNNLFPEAVLLLTTPGDNINSLKVPNLNNQIVREKILALCEEKKYCYWDFYSLMGGTGSMELWVEKGWGAKDRIHLTEAGYKMKADLFCEALFKSLIE